MFPVSRGVSPHVFYQNPSDVRIAGFGGSGLLRHGAAKRPGLQRPEHGGQRHGLPHHAPWALWARMGTRCGRKIQASSAWLFCLSACSCLFIGAFCWCVFCWRVCVPDGKGGFPLKHQNTCALPFPWLVWETFSWPLSLAKGTLEGMTK